MNAPLRIVEPAPPQDYASGYLDGLEFGQSCANRDLLLYGIIIGIVAAIALVLVVLAIGR